MCGVQACLRPTPIFLSPTRHNNRPRLYAAILTGSEKNRSERDGRFPENGIPRDRTKSRVTGDATLFRPFSPRSQHAPRHHRCDSATSSDGREPVILVHSAKPLASPDLARPRWPALTRRTYSADVLSLLM